MEERLRILAADLDEQYEEIRKLHEAVRLKTKAVQQDPNDESKVDSLGYKLHNLYCVYEDFFKLVADFFENQIEGPSRYHRQLLRRMGRELQGLRPRLLSDASHRLLDELKSFRHVFRHAYTYQLDSDLLLLLARKSSELLKLFESDYGLFRKRVLSEIVGP